MTPSAATTQEPQGEAGPSVAATSNGSAARTALTTLAVGIYFGIVLTKGELISWYRIQEMFRFQSVHMFGVLGSGVATAWIGLRLVRFLGLKGPDGRPAVLEPKPGMNETTPRFWLGGTVFGLGWGLLGACPGPIYALFGAGVTVIVVPFLAALMGVWTYAVLQPRLPH